MLWSTVPNAELKSGRIKNCTGLRINSEQKVIRDLDESRLCALVGMITFQKYHGYSCVLSFK